MMFFLDLPTLLPMRHPLFTVAIILVPNVFFLLSCYRYCKKTEKPVLLWLSAVFAMPCVGIPYLLAPPNNPESTKGAFVRLAATALILQLIFLFSAWVIDKA